MRTLPSPPPGERVRVRGTRLHLALGQGEEAVEVNRFFDGTDQRVEKLPC
jgi:hypothetical protein